jgi:hypothetical protein
MLDRRQILTIVAFFGIGCLSTPSYADDYSSASWYRNWLLSRQGGAAALYNQPCTVSDGARDTAVPCQIVAMVLDGDFTPGGYSRREAAVGDMREVDGVLYADPYVRRSFHVRSPIRVARMARRCSR